MAPSISIGTKRLAKPPHKNSATNSTSFFTPPFYGMTQNYQAYEFIPWAGGLRFRPVLAKAWIGWDSTALLSPPGRGIMALFAARDRKKEIKEPIEQLQSGLARQQSKRRHPKKQKR